MPVLKRSGPRNDAAFLFVCALIAIPAIGADTSLYEEDLLASAPIRGAQWKQMQAYADSLPHKPAPPLGGGFRQVIGYPPPGFLNKPSGHFDRIAEDSVATYYPRVHQSHAADGDVRPVYRA